MVDPGNPGETSFFTQFTVDQPAGSILLYVRSFRKVSIFLNGVCVLPFDKNPKNWKNIISMDITGHVTSGMNILHANVQNDFGPPLLYLHINGLPNPIRTDHTWFAKTGDAPPVRAVVADDTRIYPESRTIPSPMSIMKTKYLQISSIFLLAVIIMITGNHLTRGRNLRFLPIAIATGVTFFWFFLFFHKIIKTHPFIGFDAQNHLQYIMYLIKNRAIPLPNEGCSMFHHPPLYYAISAFGVFLTSSFSRLGPLIFVKAISFLCGLGNVWIVYLAARKIFKDDVKKTVYALLFAGILPVNIYMSSYAGNEPLHTFLVTLSLFITVKVILSEKVNDLDLFAIGITLGLAILTKVTAIVIIPLILFIIGLKISNTANKDPCREIIRDVGIISVAIFALSGWYYIRNIHHFGQPFVVNWRLPPLMWWQDPGFHTIRYLTQFGESLRYPFFSGFYSFWDSLYSTLWGDGFIGGLVSLSQKSYTSWNYDYMSIGYLMAVPTIPIILIGILKQAFNLLSFKDYNYKVLSFLMLLCAYLVLFFVCYTTFKIPVFSQAKSSYCLAALIPVSFIFAEGFHAVAGWFNDPRLAFFKNILHGWLITLMVVIFIAFAG